jgi:hypothetical protein
VSKYKKFNLPKLVSNFARRMLGVAKPTVVLTEDLEAERLRVLGPVLRDVAAAFAQNRGFPESSVFVSLEKGGALVATIKRSDTRVDRELVCVADVRPN